MKLQNDDDTLGEIASREDAEAIRESIRGDEFKYGVASNALDYALSGDERHLVYLSPRDRKRATALAAEIRAAFGT